VSSHVARADPRALARRIALPRVDAGALATLAFGALLAAVALEGQGGLQLGPLTTVEIFLEAIAGVAAAAALLTADRTQRAHGALALALFALLLAFTATSITWAIDGSDAWIEANRTLAWFATFVLGFALARLAPQRWPALLGGVILAAVVVCGYAVLTKVFPGALNPDETLARLRAPFGYWNSVGLLAAMASPACLWLGARRSGHAAVNALAYPALGLLLVACLLAYSRGSLLALLVGCGVWFAVVPLRLRGVAVLAAGGLAGLFVALWAFSQDALSVDRIAVGERAAAGHELGVLVVATLVVLLIVGLAVNFALAERAPRPVARRHVAVAVAACVALVPVLAVGALASSERGLTGSISSGWNNLTDTNARTPANDPNRLTAAGSVRARYWDEALKIWRDHELVGVGAGGYRTARLRIRTDQLNVRHAHGYVVQTMADLGIAGLAISLALAAAWLASAARTSELWPPRRRRLPYTPERIGMLTLLALVIVFAVHSLIDWTWAVPGNVVPAMLCAGWLAGRGPVGDPLAAPRPWGARLRGATRSPVRIIATLAALELALVAAWATWQPQRAVNATDSALLSAEANRLPDARADVRRARDADPLSLAPLFAGASVELTAGDPAAARRLYVQAIGTQPSSPEPWLQLAQFELAQGRPQRALGAIGPALYLDPRSSTVQRTYLFASRAETERRAAAAKRRSDARKRSGRNP
jgi:tetratricopeptide (TPR) repeat protein